MSPPGRGTPADGRVLSSAVAAVAGAQLENDERWPQEWWVDTLLPHVISSDEDVKADVVGLLIMNDGWPWIVEPVSGVAEFASVGDLGPLLLERAREAQRDAAASNGPFDHGKQMGLYNAISLMKSEAITFDMDDSVIGLEGVDVDELLA